MAQLKITDLIKTLEDTRAALLSATNGDGIVSRNDLKNLLEQTRDPLESRFLEFFYGFLRKLEDKPNMRVTKEAIDKGITFIQEQIIPNFEIQDHFTPSTNQKIAQAHPAALPMAMELIRATSSSSDGVLSPKEVSEQIAHLKEGLFFDDYGSEAGIAIEPFFVVHQDATLTPESFSRAMGLDPDTPKGKIERYAPADRSFLTFIEQHVSSGLAGQAQMVVDLMKTNLADHHVIIVGEDNHPDLESNHPVYVVGIGYDGNLAGFESVVIWT